MISIIINPIAGTGGRRDAARRRAELAAAICERQRTPAEVFVTERGGHARDLAAAAVTRGARLVIAWGGDGTVNEVASALVFTKASLGIVPTGSGNGLARELGVPCDAAQAIEMALTGRERPMDAGEIDGRLFFNIAGIGFDARVAHKFAATGLVRRGLRRYAEITLRELLTFTPDDYTIVSDEQTLHVRAMLIAIANSRQYGHGARIAPHAHIDDGKLDIVVVAHRSVGKVLLQLPRLFGGSVASVPGVTLLTTTTLEVVAAGRVPYHVDGEPFTGGSTLRARVLPQALRVRVGGLPDAG